MFCCTWIVIARACLFRGFTIVKSPIRLTCLPFPKPQRINPLHRIRRIRIQVQPTRIADRVFADKPSGPWIIVPIPIVVQPCFVIVVLALKTNRIGQSFLPCPFRALFFDFSPHPVLGASGDLSGQFLWRAQMVALVPGQQAHRLVAQCLGHRDEGAGFVEVVDGFATGAESLRATLSQFC